MSPLVSLRNLTKRFQTGSGTVHAVEDVSLDIPKGAIMGLVGESGSGKTTLGRTLLRLVEPTSGQVIFDGQDITALPPREMREMRRRMQIIFQDPVSSLNPRVAALLEEVGLSPDHMDRYPHAFSGGQRQRIGLARTLALEPEFIVADESVSALDVSIQAQVLNLLLDLRKELGLTYVLISHNLAVVEHLATRVSVMYLGRLMEVGPVTDVHRASGHPYTRALNSAIPLPDPRAPRDRVALQGDIPSPLSPPSGCVFRTRCAFAEESCARGTPEAHALAPDHLTYCKIPEVRHVQ